MGAFFGALVIYALCVVAEHGMMNAIGPGWTWGDSFIHCIGCGVIAWIGFATLASPDERVRRQADKAFGRKTRVK